MPDPVSATATIACTAVALLVSSTSAQDPARTEARPAQHGSLTMEFRYGDGRQVRYLENLDTTGEVKRSIELQVKKVLRRSIGWLFHPALDHRLVLLLRERGSGSSTSTLELAYYLARVTQADEKPVTLRGALDLRGAQQLDPSWRKDSARNPRDKTLLSDRIVALVAARLDDRGFEQRLAREVALAVEVHLRRNVSGKWECVLPLPLHIFRRSVRESKSVSRAAEPPPAFRVRFDDVDQICFAAPTSAAFPGPFQNGIVLPLKGRLPADLTPGRRETDVLVHYDPPTPGPQPSGLPQGRHPSSQEAADFRKNP